MTFIHDNFLLQTETAQRMYHDWAKDQPILDYHNHLPPQDVAENRRFNNLADIWLEGDHYKWRAMRANGVAEPYCTGEAEPWDKFLAWAKTVPHTLRNPLYHWTHLELKRYFGIDVLLSEKTADAIWDAGNAALSSDELTACGILKKFNVKALCTTDDPIDDLAFHQQIANSDLETRVYPAFRPDQALGVDQPQQFNAWVDYLGAASNIDISSFDDFLSAIKQRHDYFHEMGSRLSDHGLNHCYCDDCTDDKATVIFHGARAGKAADPTEHAQFASYMMMLFGRLDAEKGWTKQLHLGPRRNNNSRAFRDIGPDAGFDSIGDWRQADALATYLDKLDAAGALPKMVVYTNNPTDNFTVCSMLGNFQDGITPGKMQFGSGWWYLDQKEGMQWQMNALSNIGLISRFVGMLTDSRSFMSFPRHEYFRRVLCDLIGRDVENGELPADDDLLRPLIENICYGNAKAYLGLDVPD
jgi:glucuronate isomerase